MLCIIVCWDIVASNLFQILEVVIAESNNTSYKSHNTDLFGARRTRSCYSYGVPCSFLAKSIPFLWELSVAPSWWWQVLDRLVQVWPRNKLLITYVYHHNLFWITSNFWVLTINKDRIFWKNLLENKEMDFKKYIFNIQAAGYNGTRTCTCTRTVTIRMSTCVTYVDQNSFHLICLIKSLIGGGNSYHD